MWLTFFSDFSISVNSPIILKPMNCFHSFSPLSSIFNGIHHLILDILLSHCLLLMSFQIHSHALRQKLPLQLVENNYNKYFRIRYYKMNFGIIT